MPVSAYLRKLRSRASLESHDRGMKRDHNSQRVRHGIVGVWTDHRAFSWLSKPRIVAATAKPSRGGLETL